MSAIRIRTAIVAIAVAAIAIVISLVSLISLHFHLNSTEFHPQLVEFNQAIKAAYEAKLSLSHSIFEYGIVMLGALWALVVFRSDVVTIDSGDYPEILTFGCANALFIVFTIAHHYYIESLIAALLYAGKPGSTPEMIYDLHIWELERAFWIQVTTLILFLAIGGTALFSVNRLK